ncbi:hypothetical protein BGZ98_001477, partial [Dissophora globulifera]
MATQDVALDSYSNTVLTLLISNKLVNIKDSVFEEYQKENQTHPSCGRLCIKTYDGVDIDDRGSSVVCAVFMDSRRTNVSRWRLELLHWATDFVRTGTTRGLVDNSRVDDRATYACLVAMKLLIKINLLGFAHQWYQKTELREEMEQQTDRAMRKSDTMLEKKAV